MNKDLLACVFEESNVTYLSDLKFIKKDAIVDVLRNINISDYPIDEWKEFYLYIIGEETSCNTREEIKDELINNIT